MNRMKNPKKLEKLFKGWRVYYSQRYEIDYDGYYDRPIMAVRWRLTDGQGGESEWNLIEKDGFPNELELFFRSLPWADEWDMNRLRKEVR